MNFWKKLTILDAIHGVSQAWSSVKSITLVRSWMKLLPDLEGDFEGFSESEVSESNLRELVNEMKGFENVDEEDLCEWLEGEKSESGFRHMTDEDIINVYAAALTGQTGEEGSGGSESGESEDKGSSDRMSHSQALVCVDNLLEYMEHCGFSYNDIIAAKKIRGQVKKAINDSLKQTKLTDYLRK